jgi:hypothetical protein
MSSSISTHGLTKDRLDVVVESLKRFMANEDIRVLGQRAVQGKVWHRVPEVARYMADLRREEEAARADILSRMSVLIYRFHEFTLDATLARAGLMSDARVNAGSSLDKKTEFDLFCLDSKERLYLICKHYGWLPEFFRLYPQHFYENSFRFVDLIPPKKLPIKVKVIGLGIGGSLAVSGLAKCGIECVQGYEQRERSGLGSVGSRYQNASWRAYDIAEKMLDQEAFDVLCKYRQRLNVTYDDGSSHVIATDRVQIIIGNAVDSALDSAQRYGADLRFGHSITDAAAESPCDIMALFCGAHTMSLSPVLEEQMGVYSWPSLSSPCKMWLRMTESEHRDAYCTRGGEIGAEKWHYTIKSSRDEVDDVLRVRAALLHQYKASHMSEDEKLALPDDYHHKIAQIDKILSFMHEGAADGVRFDYEFTNAPDNEHNRAKREDVGRDGTVVLDGGYCVDIKLASKAVIGIPGQTNPSAESLLSSYGASLVVTGGDATVPPNPLAAYGATLACEAADMLVQLSVAHGHLNAIILGMEEAGLSGECFVSDEWIAEVKSVKRAFSEYYDARGRSENYFQWIQTLICNLYSIPSFS